MNDGPTLAPAEGEHQSKVHGPGERPEQEEGRTYPTPIPSPPPRLAATEAGEGGGGTSAPLTTVVRSVPMAMTMRMGAGGLVPAPPTALLPATAAAHGPVTPCPSMPTSPIRGQQSGNALQLPPPAAAPARPALGAATTCGHATPRSSPSISLPPLPLLKRPQAGLSDAEFLDAMRRSSAGAMLLPQTPDAVTTPGPEPLACRKRRKTALPTKAVTRPASEVEREHQGIVVLDVYSMYLLHPACLLSTRASRDRSKETASSAITSASNAPLTRRGSALGGFGRARSCNVLGATSTGMLRPASVTPPPSSVSGRGRASSAGLYPASPGACIVPRARSNSEATAALLDYATAGRMEEGPGGQRRKGKASLRWTEYTDTHGAPKVYWKGSTLKIPETAEGYALLTKEEVRTCSALRILPAQYLNMKRVLLTAVESRGPFKKREAQTWFRIDVNKTCLIYDWFRALEWIPSFEEWSERQDQAGASPPPA